MCVYIYIYICMIININVYRFCYRAVDYDQRLIVLGAGGSICRK